MKKKQIIYSADFAYAGKTHKKKYSIAIEDGKIIESGKREVIKEQFPYAKETKFDGALYPGFIDSHLHLNQLALSLTTTNAKQFNTFEGLKKAITECKNDTAYVYNLNFNKVSAPEWEELFKINCPLFIQSTDEHSVFINKALMKEKGVVIKEIPGGEIVKKNSKFTGILKDNAIKNVKNIVNRKAETEGIEKAEKLLLMNGIVAATNFDYELFNTLRERANKIHIFQGIQCDKLNDAIEQNFKTGEGSPYFRIGAVKCFLDGSLGSQTALMEENIFNGLLTIPEEEFRTIVEKANRNGLQVAVHAIGSKAVQIALKTFKEKGNPEMRNRIEHLQFINEKDISLVEKTDFIASMQPMHFSEDSELLQKYIGEYKYAYSWKTVLNLGKVLAFGSDAPVVPPSVIRGMECAIHRENGKIKPDDAITAYTEGGARANFYERYGGRIVRGLNADFSILSKPISEESKFTNIKTYATIIGGDIKWTA